MLRKLATVAAAMAIVGAGSVGVANAATPEHFPHIPHVPHIGGGLLGGLGLGGLLGGGFHHGGHFGGGNFGGRFGGTFWQRDGVILPYSQLGSSCGCSVSDPVSLGYTEVVQPAQIEVVPVGAVATGDGSCETLTSVDFSRPGWNRGVRFFRR